MMLFYNVMMNIDLVLKIIDDKDDHLFYSRDLG